MRKDELLVRAEYAATHAARLGVHPKIELVPEGELPRTEFKAKRVIDDRALYRAQRGD